MGEPIHIDWIKGYVNRSRHWISPSRCHRLTHIMIQTQNLRPTHRRVIWIVRPLSPKATS